MFELIFLVLFPGFAEKLEEHPFPLTFETERQCVEAGWVTLLRGPVVINDEDGSLRAAAIPISFQCVERIGT